MLVLVSSEYLTDGLVLFRSPCHHLLAAGPSSPVCDLAYPVQLQSPLFFCEGQGLNYFITLHPLMKPLEENVKKKNRKQNPTTIQILFIFYIGLSIIIKREKNVIIIINHPI